MLVYFPALCLLAHFYLTLRLVDAGTYSTKMKLGDVAACFAIGIYFFLLINPAKNPVVRVRHHFWCYYVSFFYGASIHYRFLQLLLSVSFTSFFDFFSQNGLVMMAHFTEIIAYSVFWYTSFYPLDNRPKLMKID
ncbi:hypothetical protein WR25_26203 [Diploscapter pachys]|uniref:Uncharacterized protein n=1 Tax=Diploscapter pachys TaxID=2018661 RepID=A0A2A2M2S1_9BILA|nr:hypothetical protein WR25_26203 [Diploscapter pachys]